MPRTRLIHLPAPQVSRKSICASCGETFEQCYGERRKLCGLNACYAQTIREYWRKLGFVASVKYEDGHPRLVGVPVKT